jgi:hypothetical protein
MGFLSITVGIPTLCWGNCTLCHSILGGGGKTVTDDEMHRLLHSSLSIPMGELADLQPKMETRMHLNLEVMPTLPEQGQVLKYKIFGR